MNKKQRLVVCLDGTWNNRDDSTNILHHFGLASEGESSTANGVTQVKYYDEGVGTGVIDGITGGGFGFGLEENVREGYDWLVEKYHDNDDPEQADEIYIFGFSRGAYTARSLVGFISTCGLIRRGSPLSVNELWEAYCLLGREREHRNGVWDRVFGKSPAGIRKITDLVCDPWNIKRFEEQRTQKQGESSGSDSKRMPGQLVDNLSAAESLLVRWSRRVRITYLGVYDTVGAMGIDALAIPGVKSKLAMHHNMRATTLVQNCRHALAIDEHRSSFSLTPLLQYIGHGFHDDDQQSNSLEEGENVGASMLSKAETYWTKKEAVWRDRIEQRWFAGAHSNIGGGYPDNVLAQRPFKWLLEEAAKAGLESESFSSLGPATFPLPQDSYAQFAKPFWTQIIRGKRFYRPIAPPPEIRANTAKAKKNEAVYAGFHIESINETIDGSVFDVFEANAHYRPPNLFEYAARRRAESPCLSEEEWQAIAAQKPKHEWIGATMGAHLILVLWATCASLGLWTLNELFAMRVDSPRPIPPAVLCAAAFLFALMDWGESRANFALAVSGASARWRAFLDSIYWTRTLGFILFAFGAIATVCALWRLGWHAQSPGEAWNQIIITKLLVPFWPVPACAAAGIVLANLLDGAGKQRQKSGFLGAIAGVVIALVAVPGLVFLGEYFARIFTPLFGHPGPLEWSTARNAPLAGLLLQLLLALFYFLNAFTWVGEPMSRANLGSIWSLQHRFTPGGVQQTLERWRSMLACVWSGEDKDKVKGPAARAMREAVRESLWRDIFGYIPLYFCVLTYGLWFAQQELEWDWLGPVFRSQLPLWFLLPLTAALADYGEDICHFRYLRLHENGAPPSTTLTMFSCTMTMIKFAAVISAFLLTLGALVLGNVKIFIDVQGAGWRGTVALLLSTFIAVAFLAILVGSRLYRIRSSRIRAQEPLPDPSPGAA